MRISLVVPTRERVEYLASCLDTARRVEDPDLEIIVSDNHSQDATEAVVAARSDPRVRYTRTPARCSMRENFEHALATANGDYLVFIGDDDGVLPSGMARLRALLERERPEAVSWRPPKYFWPLDDSQHLSGCARIRMPTPFRRPKQTPLAILQDICAARISRMGNYFHTAVYHGCVARALIERVRAVQDGVYFRGAIPDIYSSLANLRAMSSDRPLCWLGHPATFNGTSPRSNGANHLSLSSISQAGLDEMAAFKEESGSDEGAALMDVNIPFSDALALDMLDMALAGRPEHAWIDWAAWLRRLHRQIAKMPKTMHVRSISALDAYCRAKGLSKALDAAGGQRTFSGPDTMPGQKIHSQTSTVRVRKIELAHPVGLATAADAGHVIEEVFGQAPPGSERRPLVTASMESKRIAGRYAKWFGAMHRARRIAKRWETQASEAS